MNINKKTIKKTCSIAGGLILSGSFICAFAVIEMPVLLQIFLLAFAALSIKFSVKSFYNAPPEKW